MVASLSANESGGKLTVLLEACADTLRGVTDEWVKLAMVRHGLLGLHPKHISLDNQTVDGWTVFTIKYCGSPITQLRYRWGMDMSLEYKVLDMGER